MLGTCVAGAAAMNGGYERSAAASASPMRRVRTGIELGETGKVSRLTTWTDQP
jgi:hypothetical protein